MVRAVLDEDFQWMGQCPAWHDTRLDGLNYVILLQWPGKTAQGNGTQQILIDARANAWQREALRKILHGEATAQGATHFFVF
ncbi:MAG: DUF1326 domain-containing protein, partial [Nitrospira sp.]|nr:DUF1326 domain-containing protein [Nitrospira sp.]